MTIGLASDHAGFELKEYVRQYLDEQGIAYKDYGTHSTDSCDYPDFAHALARGIEQGEVDLGIAFCGTGNGMAMSLNHHPGIRAGLAWNTEIGKLVKEHNNANILVMPARFISYNMVTSIVRAWLNTEFAGGRHQRRIDKIPVK